MLNIVDGITANYARPQSLILTSACDTEQVCPDHNSILCSCSQQKWWLTEGTLRGPGWPWEEDALRAAGGGSRSRLLIENGSGPLKCSLGWPNGIRSVRNERQKSPREHGRPAQHGGSSWWHLKAGRQRQPGESGVPASQPRSQRGRAPRPRRPGISARGREPAPGPGPARPRATVWSEAGAGGGCTPLPGEGWGRQSLSFAFQ